MNRYGEEAKSLVYYQTRERGWRRIRGEISSQICYLPISLLRVRVSNRVYIQIGTSILDRLRKFS
jgi:hypothetical protein